MGWKGNLLVIFGITLLSLPALATGTSNSVAYSWLETDSPERKAFIHKENEKLHDKLNKSHNREAVKAWLERVYDVPTTLQTVTLKDKRQLKLVDRGVGKPTELVLADGSDERVLYSNYEYMKNYITTFVAFYLSPKEHYIAMVLALRGSIDEARVDFYDLQKNEILPNSRTVGEPQVGWGSETQLIFTQFSTPDIYHTGSYDVEKDTTSVIGNGGNLFDSTDWIAYFGNSGNVLQNKNNLHTINVQGTPLGVAGADADNLYLWMNGPNGLGEIRRFADAQATQPVSGNVVLAEGKNSIISATGDDSTFFVMTRNGADRYLAAYDYSGKLITQFQAPNCCSVSEVSWATKNNTLKVILRSQVQKSKTYHWNVAQGNWDSSAIDSEMLTDTDGTTFKTEVDFATSKDGTSVPIRLTYLADSEKDGSHPAYMESYGGFGLAGYLDPTYDPVTRDFIKRGGIHVGTGIRGGNEYGPSWHTSATLDKKPNTFYDLISAANLLVSSGWTTHDKIISTGTSNGGLTVAASSLLAPGTFGLVVPISGVQDMLGIDHLDANDDGWSSEYGLSTASYVALYSPVEIAAQQGSTEFLIIDGIDDGRVNPANSFKLAAAIEALGGGANRVHLASLKNAGHWNASYIYQNMIAIRSNTYIWTTIFDHLGWNW